DEEFATERPVEPSDHGSGRSAWAGLRPSQRATRPRAGARGAAVGRLVRREQGKSDRASVAVDRTLGAIELEADDTSGSVLISSRRLAADRARHGRDLPSAHRVLPHLDL